MIAVSVTQAKTARDSRAERHGDQAVAVSVAGVVCGLRVMGEIFVTRGERWSAPAWFRHADERRHDCTGARYRCLRRGMQGFDVGCTRGIL